MAATTTHEALVRALTSEIGEFPIPRKLPPPSTEDWNNQACLFCGELKPPSRSDESSRASASPVLALLEDNFVCSRCMSLRQSLPAKLESLAKQNNFKFASEPLRLRNQASDEMLFTRAPFDGLQEQNEPAHPHKETKPVPVPTFRNPAPAPVAEEPDPAYKAHDHISAPEVRKPISSPDVEESAPKPLAREIAPEAKAREPAPKTKAREPAHRPKARESAPKTKSRESVPKPKTREPTSKPRAREIAPMPRAREIAPRPTAREIAPRPTAREIAPKPKAQERAPQPNNQKPAPPPKTQEPAPTPAVKDPVPEPMVRERVPPPRAQEPVVVPKENEPAPKPKAQGPPPPPKVLTGPPKPYAEEPTSAPRVQEPPSVLNAQEPLSRPGGHDPVFKPEAQEPPSRPEEPIPTTASQGPKLVPFVQNTKKSNVKLDTARPTEIRPANLQPPSHAFPPRVIELNDPSVPPLPLQEQPIESSRGDKLAFLDDVCDELKHAETFYMDLVQMQEEMQEQLRALSKRLHAVDANCVRLRDRRDRLRRALGISMRSDSSKPFRKRNASAFLDGDSGGDSRHLSYLNHGRQKFSRIGPSSGPSDSTVRDSSNDAGSQVPQAVRSEVAFLPSGTPVQHAVMPSAGQVEPVPFANGPMYNADMTNTFAHPRTIMQATPITQTVPQQHSTPQFGEAGHPNSRRVSTPPVLPDMSVGVQLTSQADRMGGHNGAVPHGQMPHVLSIANQKAQPVRKSWKQRHP